MIPVYYYYFWNKYIMRMEVETGGVRSNSVITTEEPGRPTAKYPLPILNTDNKNSDE